MARAPGLDGIVRGYRVHAKRLNLIANLALFASSAALAATLWYKGFHTRSPVDSNAASRVSYPLQVGQSSPNLPGIDFTQAGFSVVVFVSTVCRYCESSVPFYNKLWKGAMLSRNRWRLFTVFLQSEDEVRSFKSRVDLKADAIANVDFRRYGVRSVPAVLLVDNKGIITRMWLGASEEHESAIIAALKESIDDPGRGHSENASEVAGGAR